MLFQLLCLTVALSIDSLGIGISYGIRKISLHPMSIMIISLISIVFSTASILLGNVINKFLPEKITTFISIIILFFMGIWVIYNAIGPKKEAIEIKDNTNCSGNNSLIFRFFKYLVMTAKTMKEPENFDIDNSLKIEPKEAFYLGIAVSIDSMGVGLAIYSMNSYSYLFPIFIMIFQLAFLSLGILLGKRLNYKNSNEKFWGAISGFILISISVLRLIAKF